MILTTDGLEIGANAEIAAYFSGFRKPMMRAPCPPIECPIMDACMAIYDSKLAHSC